MNGILFPVLFAIMTAFPGTLSEPPVEARTYDIVVYGGSFASCAAAFQAAPLLPGNGSILMIVPESALGSVGTAGGQNFFDVRGWNSGYVTQGSFTRLWDAYGQGYPVQAMAALLNHRVVGANKTKVQVAYNCEVEEVVKDKQGNIEELSVRPVMRNPRTMKVMWAGSPVSVGGKVFIDGSETGRLARLAATRHTVGRESWKGDMHQQAATLMFKVRGVDPTRATAYRNPSGQQEFTFIRDDSNSWIGWGGKDFVERDPVLASYNNGLHRFRVKGYNIAEDEPGTWWVNALLIFEVDARKQEIDRNTSRWPVGSEGTISTDEAMGLAREEIQSDRFLQALRRFPGFENASLVRDDAGYPLTGEVLYLRESIHTADQDGNYALTGDEVRGAGNSTLPGADQDNYLSRIGLGRYYVDVNGYLKNESVQTLELPANPAYVPAEALLAANVPNLLVPGYAQGSDPTAWAMMRVIPNLNVCGDAAGVIAAYSLIQDEDPANILTTHLAEIQQRLTNAGAKLEKN